MHFIDFPIAQWCCWFPAQQPDNPMPERLPSDDGSLPPLPFVPAMARRRLTRLTKMALAVAQPLTGEAPLATVFASQHGEVSHTVSLLDAALAGEPMSPTRFSQSVHNTASGAFGIQFGNTQASTSVSAGEETLLAALVEAKAQLHRGRDVLVVYVDDPLPDRFQQYRQRDDGPMALALLLSAQAPHQLSVQFAEATGQFSESSLPWTLAKRLSDGPGETHFDGERRQLRWRYQPC
ncbi:beta-ketoacyl synthase chain length factor [Ferrimonas balearica]|uniref:beta-ketoacyl synthase chain length factor n=1 Tax=Ferrimonas balearica TaxID=44012 RepID=UPI001C94CC88|nr:beta-ketoacyl synthase chain length factor [Ferrimonas balearica]MBY6224015.1 beta-ketoacyl synthase chain length factor [Ferrimonas balearica]